jgi:Lrp/AsnC family leucine-responsive transcriptional regulator
MDATDLKIIDILKKNARIPSSEIGRKIHLSTPAVSERLRKLDAAGIISQYTVRLDRKKCNLHLLAFTQITLDHTQNLEGFRKAIIQFEHVLECYHIAGDYDYLLKISVADTDALEQFLSYALRSIPGIVRTSTKIVLSTLKEEINV